MLIYEITIRVRDDLRAAWEKYLPAHTAEVMETGCFESGRLLRGGDGEYRCAYVVATRADLDRYLTEHAPALRADAIEHFPDGVETVRAIWTEWQRVDR